MPLQPTESTRLSVTTVVIYQHQLFYGYPTEPVVGCVFHLKQAIARKLNVVGRTFQLRLGGDGNDTQVNTKALDYIHVIIIFI